MKKEIYNQAMTKLKMSDDCLGAILDNIDEIPASPQEKKVSHIRLLPLLTAAVVFVFGGLTVAAETGVLDWVKLLFNDNDVPAFYLENSGKMNDFKCESDFGIKLSPVGVLGGGKELCCMFNIAKLPEGIGFENLAINVSDKMYKNSEADGTFLGGYTHTNINQDNMLGIMLYSDSEMFATGKEIIFNVCASFDSPKKYVDFREKYGFEENESLDIAEISFILDAKKSKTKVIDYSTYMCSDIPKRNYDFMFDKIEITPLTVHSKGTRMFYADELLNSSDMLIIFEDGSSLNLSEYGRFGSTAYDMGSFSFQDVNTTLEDRALMYADADTRIHSTWYFDKPIDPDTVREIWLGEMRIYNAKEE